MKRVFLISTLCASLAGPTYAQEDDGTTMMERGAQEFLEGLLREMEPAWREMQGFMDQMGPAMLELMDQIQDWSAYEAPEILDNGDIIIRRKPDAPEKETPAPDLAPQIEL
jgi:hypothetical protein